MSAVARSARFVGSLRVLTVNDIYSSTAVNGEGGWSGLSTLLAHYRTPSSLTCICGDFLGGSALAEFHRGKQVVEIISRLRADALLLGNHEFDYGATELQTRMRETAPTTKWFGSNVREWRREGATDVAESELFREVTDVMQIRINLQREDAPATTAASSGTSAAATSSPFPDTAPVSLGLFGLCTPHTPQLSWPGPSVVFMPVHPVAERCMALLKGTATDAQAAATIASMPVLELPRRENNDPVAAASSESSTAAASSSPATAASSSTSASAAPFLPCDSLIALTHLSLAEDRRLARAYGGDGLSLVLGGHDHDAVSLMESNTLVFKAGQNALWLGIVDLRVELTLTEKDEARRAEDAALIAQAAASSSNSSASAEAITPAALAAARYPFIRSVYLSPSWRMVSNRAVPSDPEVDQIVLRATSEMERAQELAEGDPEEVICEVGSAEFLPFGMTSLSADLKANLLLTRTSAVRAGPSSFADAVADAMASHYSTDGNHCDGAVINGGFIRGDRSYAQGTRLRRRDILSELPFPKVCVLLRISGAGLVQALGEMLAPAPTPAGCYPHVSRHLQVLFDPAEPAGSKRKIRHVLLQGQPVDPRRQYQIAVTTFMASGGDGVTGWTTGQIVSTDGFKVSKLVLKHLQLLKVLRPNIVPRVAPDTEETAKQRANISVQSPAAPPEPECAKPAAW